MKHITIEEIEMIFERVWITGRSCMSYTGKSSLVTRL